MTTAPSYFASPRAKLLWAIVGVLVAVQVAALYMLCDGQMDRARQRQAALERQQMAVNDCLRHSPGLTIGDCMQQPSAQGEKASPAPRGTDALAAASPAVLTNATPVSFSYR